MAEDLQYKFPTVFRAIDRQGRRKLQRNKIVGRVLLTRGENESLKSSQITDQTPSHLTNSKRTQRQIIGRSMVESSNQTGQFNMQITPAELIMNYGNSTSQEFNQRSQVQSLID